MASTSGTSTPASARGKKASLTCGVCLDIFTEPKILPCFHIFCLKCLENLPQEASVPPQNRQLSCPTCREIITVPAGGVSAFKTDFHIDAEELEKARNGLYCKHHPSKELELYCENCKVPACTKCMFLSHKGHEMLDMAEVTARKQLQDDRRRLKRAASELESNMDKAEKDQKEVLKKTRVLEQKIQEKHLAMHAAADSVRDETLARLRTLTDKIIADQMNELQRQQDTLRQIEDLEWQVQQTLEGKAGYEQVMSTATEMKSGSGSESSLQKLKAQLKTTVTRPVLRCTVSPKAFLQGMRDYMGSAVKMEMAVTQPKVTVVEQFRCRQNPDTDIFCVCPLDDITVFLSYRSRNFLGELPTEKYILRRGEGFVRTELNAKGCVTYFNKGILRGRNISSGAVFSKSAIVFKVMASGAGAFHATRVEIADERQDELKLKAVRIFELNDCDSVHGFDASSDEQLFAVVQEKETQDPKREVKVYQRQQRTNGLVYSSPVQPFLPSDVCFFTLGGQEVLLVADELNDAIHVVNVQDGQPSFSHYLAPGCPLLVQPTALNTDQWGRLWVACRGGTILACSEQCGG